MTTVYDIPLSLFSFPFMKNTIVVAYYEPCRIDKTYLRKRGYSIASGMRW